MNKSDLKRSQGNTSRKKERRQSSGSRKRSQEERVKSPKIKVVQSQKALIQGNAKQATQNQVDLVPQRDFSKKIPETGRYGSDWQMDGPDSFLNQKFKTNLNSSKMQSSKNSLFQTKAAQFVSQSYQTQSLLPNLNYSINQHSVNEESQEESVPSSLAKNSKNEYVARNTALEAQLTSSQNDKSELMFTKVYVMGETKHGQLGFMLDENTDSVIRMPKLCNYNVLVKQIACGEAHTHILSREGFVYSMGVNHYGVLGLSVSEMQLNSVTEPQLITTLSAITQIATGRAHTLALSANRTIYAWGRQDNGAISVRIAENHVPAVLDFNLTAKKGNKLAQIVKVSAGLEHSMFLTNSRDVFGCGEGEHGQLGLGYCSLIEYRPLKVRFKDLHELDEITDVACGAYHTLFLTKHHAVYSTGLNNVGQLGLSADDPKIYVPQLITDLNGRFISKVEAGESSFALNDQGEIFVWGYYNQQVFKKPFMPSSIQAPVRQVSQSFYGVTSLVDQDNRLWVWDSKSQNSQDMLGLQTYPQLLRPMRNKHVIRTFCGRGLVFALGEDVTAGRQSPKAVVTIEQNQVSINTTAQFSKQRNSKVQQKLPDLSLSEIKKTSESPKPKRQRPNTRQSTHSRSRSKSRKRENTHRKSASAGRKTTPDIKRLATQIRKINNSKSVSRSKSRDITRDRIKNEAYRDNSKNQEKSRDVSKSREIKRLPVKKDSFENKSYSLTQAFKIINKAQKKSKPDDPIRKLITKKFNGLLKRLDQDLKNLDIKMNNTDRKPDKKIKSKVLSADNSPVVINRERSNKPQRRKSTKSQKKRSRSRASTNSKSQKKQKRVKSVLKHASTQLLIDNTMTVDPKHSYGAFSPAVVNKAVETATSPACQIVSDLKTKESKSEYEAESQTNTRKSVQPLSDVQYQHQHAALEQFQEYAKTTMQQLYVKIDTLREENFALKRELDQSKRNSESVKGELTLVKEQSATQLLTKSTIESKLRVLQIENETLKLQRADEERKITMLEDRLQKLQMSKTKEDEYLAQMGRAHENLRKERMHVKDLQNEIQSLTKSLQIMEATLNQVKFDKMRYETEIRRLDEVSKANRRQIVVEKQIDVPTVTSQCTEKNNPLSGRDQGQEFSETEKPRIIDNIGSELLSQKARSRSNSPVDYKKTSSRKSEKSDLSRRQLYEKVNKKVTCEEPKPQGRNLLLAEQVFKRTQEASTEHSMRSRSNSKSQNRKSQNQDNQHAIKDETRYQSQFQITSMDQRNSPILREPIYDTKESRETGRFVDSQQVLIAQKIRAQRSNSPKQGSPLRNPKEDPSRHKQLRDRNFQANVQLNDNKIQDPAQNSLNRFMYIHKGQGDTKEDLTRNQQYGAFPTNLDEFGYRNPQSYNKDLQDELPSDESRRDLQELKKRAIQRADTESRALSPKSIQNDQKVQKPQTNDQKFEKPKAIELHDNRSKQEDFKHYAPSMRYLDNSLDSKRTIQKLNGLEKENVKPEDRLSKQDQYNQMLLNNLEKLADKKMAKAYVDDRVTSRQSHDKFISNFEIQKSPRSGSRSSNGRHGSSIGLYNAISNTQQNPQRKQIVALLDHSNLGQSLDPPPQRSRSGQGSQEPRLCQSQSNEVHRRKANKSHVSDDNSSNSFLAKRVALQNRLKNL